jgi:sialate O-acetylesterase
MTASAAATAYVSSKGWDFGEATWNDHGWDNYNQPSALFNKTIAPLFGFNIGGVVWYQGESDPTYASATTMIPLLIDAWSAGFNSDGSLLPFVLIQLAPYDGTDPLLGASSSPTWIYFAEHRRAQYELVTSAVYAATTVAVPIYDVSLVWDVPTTQFAWKDPIHPVTKIPVGARAGKEAYTAFFWGAVDFLPPTVSGIETDATSITIAFDHVARGLKTFKDSAAGVLTVELHMKNGIRRTVACTIVDANHIGIVDVDVPNVAFVSYAYMTRNETANLSSSYDIPALPFFLALDGTESD